MDGHVMMKFSKFVMTLLGLWPAKLRGFKQKLYDVYFYAGFFYYITFVLSQGAMVFIAKSTFLETAGNLNVTIIYLINIYKVLICRSRTIKVILKEIEEKEQHILQNDDEEIINIYKEQVRSAFRSTLFYVSTGTTGIFLYFITPIVKNIVEEPDESGNKHKSLIFSSWFPFDSNKYYWFAYIIQLFGGFFGYSYLIHIGTFYFSILKYAVGQLKILQHVLKNISKYSRQYNFEHRLVKSKAQGIFMKLCIKEHQTTIRFIENVDKNVRMFLLLEFAVSSFQLSLVIYQLLQSNGLGVQTFAVLSYLISLSIQLFIFYWNANEIIIQSCNIAESVYEAQWFEFDLPVQKMILILMMRAQKPLSISIGPIYKVRVDSLFAIFKAIYSYIAVIQK